MKGYYKLQAVNVEENDKACYSCGDRFNRPDTCYRVTDFYGEDWSERSFCSRPCAQTDLDEANSE